MHPNFEAMFPNTIWSSEMNLTCPILPNLLFNPNIFVRARKSSFHRKRRGPSFFKSHFVPIRIGPCFCSILRNKTKSRLKSGCAPVLSRLAMDNFVEAAKIVRLFLEIRDARYISNVPKRPEQSHEGGFACAVLTNKQSQGGQAGRLFLTEATKVFQDNFIHGIDSFIARWLSTMPRHSSHFCQDTR